MYRLVMVQMEVEEKIEQNRRERDKISENYRNKSLRHAEYIRLNAINLGAENAFKDVLQILKEFEL